VQSNSAKIHVWPRDLERFPDNDEELGRNLFLECYTRSFLGSLLPEFWLFYADRIECFDLRPTQHLDLHRKQLLLSAMAGREDVTAAALLVTGRFQKRDHVGICFVEWCDNRWWLGWQPHSKKNGLFSEHPNVMRAVDGDPKPLLLGSWFSTARRLNLRLDVQSNQSQLLH